MQAPSTPPRRASRQRTPPAPKHGGDDFLRPRRSRRLTGPLQSPPASPTAAPSQSKLHSGSARNRLDNDFLSPAMLPTPSETPFLSASRKRQRASSMQESARVLSFQPENPNDIMPTLQETRRSKVRITGDEDDFGTGVTRPRNHARNAIAIYTEVQARVPEDDHSSDNVFLDVPRGRSTTVSEPSRRIGHWVESPSPPPPKKTVAQRREDARLQASVDRGEGVFMMFRGKKVYRSYAENGVEDPAKWSRQQRELKRAAGDAAARPITRSSIRPGLIWPRDAQNRNSPLPISYSDEEAETEYSDGVAEPDVIMSDPSEHATNSQEHDSGVSFAASGVHATPVKQDKISRKPMLSPPTTTRTTRQTRFEKVSSFEETLEADDEAHNRFTLPTPQRSSRKKKASFKDIPIYEDDAPEQATPARTRNKRAALQLTPIIESDDDHASADPTSSGSTATGGRGKSSPFDSWQRIKPGKKRDSDVLAADVKDAPAKRSRSGARSKSGSA